jgi:hypothetical protein
MSSRSSYFHTLYSYNTVGYETVILRRVATKPVCRQLIEAEAIEAFSIWRRLLGDMLEKPRPIERTLSRLRTRVKIQQAKRKLRSYEVGLNICRLRYYQIKHSLSYPSFEEMILMAQMNKTDAGDVNHSWKFATKIDKNLSHGRFES